MTRSRLILLATVTLFAISPAFAVDYNYTDDGTNETDARPPPSPPSINAPVDVRKNTNAPVNAPVDVRNNAPVNAPVNVRKNTTTTTDSRAVTNTDTKVNNARKESGTAKAVNGPSTSSTGPSTSGPSTSSTGPIQFQPTINVQMHSAPVNVQNTNPITLSNTSQNTNPNNLSNTSQNQNQNNVEAYAAAKVGGPVVPLPVPVPVPVPLATPALAPPPACGRGVVVNLGIDGFGRPIALNLRTGPGVQFENVPGPDYTALVLLDGTQVTICSRQGRWLNVEVFTPGSRARGWVFDRYVTAL